MRVDESDYFHKGMTSEEMEDAINSFVEACQKNNQQIPLWVRMRIDGEETITSPDYGKIDGPPELIRALNDIDREFGLKK